MAEHRASFWRGVQMGCLYGTWLSVPVFALFATLLPAFGWWFMGLAALAYVVMFWMAWTLRRADEREAEVRRRAELLRDHPDWPVCELHRHG